jgi:Ca-activated chloride channel family protein
MTTPQIEFVCLRDAVSTETTTTLDVLVRIIPPLPEVKLERLPLNLGLVIDRSGSMAGDKLKYARQAACFAVEQLQPRDRVSVTIYDDRIETIVPSCLAEDTTWILHRIQNIQERGSTALHAGWVEGGMQVSQHLTPEHLNRIILLSDGLANCGETNPDVIASDVKGLSDRGVSTTTMGVGDYYNEDLLEAMAGSGDGSYYYIESPDQLPEIFNLEMQGIMGLFGRHVRLAVTSSVGVTVADMLNDFDVAPDGRYQLPNLVKGSVFTAIARLKIPPQPQETDLCYFNLSWEAAETGKRAEISVALRLPAVSAAQLSEFPFNPEVQRDVALMMAARSKKEAIRFSDRGDYENASKRLNEARQGVLNAPASPLTQQEAQSLSDLDSDLKQRRMNAFRKRSHYESHHYQRSHTQASHGDYYSRRGYAKSHNTNSVRDRLSIIRGDITQQSVDVIVNACDRSLSGSLGVSAAIHKAAGQSLQQECHSLKFCEEGDAKITSAYNLAAKWVIHTVGPTWFKGHNREAEVLAACYQKCLQLAVQNNCKTIAFPSISTGAKGFPLDYAARIVVKEIRAFLQKDNTLETVTIVCFLPEVYRSYQDAIAPKA